MTVSISSMSFGSQRLWAITLKRRDAAYEGAIYSPSLEYDYGSTASIDTEGALDFLWDAGGQGGFQVSQTAKARLGHRVQSLRKGHGRQRLLSEKLSNHSSAVGTSPLVKTVETCLDLLAA
jgi:hypothetical protein